jgi:hypothetical protein
MIEKIMNTNFTKMRAVEADLFQAEGQTDRRRQGWLDGQTGMTKPTIVFSDFAKTPLNPSLPKSTNGKFPMFHNVPRFNYNSG